MEDKGKSYLEMAVEERGGREREACFNSDNSFINDCHSVGGVVTWDSGQEREIMWPLATPGPAKQRGQFVTSHTDNSLSSTPARISMCSKTCLFIRLMGGERVTAGKLTYMTCK